MIATVTHARIRAEQGDVDGALEVLKGVLAAAPHDPEARRLQARLAARRTAARLTRWIARVRTRRGSR